MSDDLCKHANAVPVGYYMLCPDCGAVFMVDTDGTAHVQPLRPALIADIARAVLRQAALLNAAVAEQERGG